MKTRQRGTTIIEILGAVAVGSLMLVGLTSMIDRSLEDTRGQQAALHQARIADAARKYISANYTPLKDTANQPHIVVAVPVANLITQNFLPAGFSATNNYNQTTCILVRQPVLLSGKLEALVVTTGGTPIEDRHIRMIAANAGEGGGYIAAAAPTTAQGASWSTDTAAYVGVECGNGGPIVLSGTASDAGHLVSNLFYDGPGFTDFLYRYEIDGRPDLNKMHTPIKMTEKAIVTEGTACGTHAAIAADNNRNLLRCGSNGLWTQMTYWKSPVENFTKLNELTDKVDGEVRIIRDKKRAFAWDANSNSWMALAVDQDGNMAIEKNLVVGQDVNAKWVRGEWGLSGGQVYLEYVWQAGQECAIPTLTDNGWEIWYDVGMFVRDWRGLLLSCKPYTPELAAEYPGIPAPSTGHAWVYQNGKFTP
ncbi:MAG TPA: shufflon system plasmid conjugative transfer pilus tip adhesin PilV [Noviherbaspirillum sp.]|nr:shufflon system plasmid conjugative transfer pilus tip adhesin PilV [Noviherbaspirillum sp.]